MFVGLSGGRWGRHGGDVDLSVDVRQYDVCRSDAIAMVMMELASSESRDAHTHRQTRPNEKG